MKAGDIAQWLALFCTIFFTYRSLRVARQDSVLSTYLSLNQKLQDTLYQLLAEDNDVFKRVDPADLGSLKFRFLHMFDISADLFEMQHILREFDKALWQRSDARMRKVLAKPASRMMWSRQIQKNPELFDAKFVAYVASIHKDCAGVGE